jgi:hypothetical protein
MERVCLCSLSLLYLSGTYDSESHNAAKVMAFVSRAKNDPWSK